jgi:mRNA interferase MazF
VIIVTAQAVLDHEPSVVHVVPLTSTLRAFRSEVVIEADADNGLESTSAAQCQHVRTIAVQRLGDRRGNIGPQALSQLREALADLLDI